MANNDKIDRAAEGMIAAFGRDATNQCYRQLRKMQSHGDAAGEDTWKRILFAVVQRVAGSRAPVAASPDSGG